MSFCRAWVSERGTDSNHDAWVWNFLREMRDDGTETTVSLVHDDDDGGYYSAVVYSLITFLFYQSYFGCHSSLIEFAVVGDFLL